jgi:hypothetical protein
LLQVIEDLGILAGDQRFPDKPFGPAVVDVDRHLTPGLSATAANGPHFYAFDIASVPKPVIAVQSERCTLAGAAADPRIPLLDDVKPVILAVEQQEVAGALQTLRRRNSLLLEESQLEVRGRALGTSWMEGLHGFGGSITRRLTTGAR